MIERFLGYACPDHGVRGRPEHRVARHAAMRLLAQHPGLARASLATAIVCGELEEVERILGERPELAREKTDAKGWEPLLYLTFTRLPLPRADEHAVAIARALLDRGADPNVSFMAGDSFYTPLVGAVGEGEENRPPHPRRDELARLLLERGAAPYDTQVIYDLHFRGDVQWFLELMYEFAPRRSDWDDPEWRMLDMGNYGSGARWHLHIAIERNDLRLAEWCLTHGANPNAAPESAPRFPQHSLYELAVRQGRTEMAALLARHGAAVTEVVLDGEERFIAACMRLDRAEAARLAGPYLQSPKAMFAAAKEDRADVVELLLDLGVPADVANDRNRSALHVAAASDATRTAELLVRRGADVDPVETEWESTPLGTAVYYEHAALIELLARHSRDVWNLTFIGNAERLREVLDAEPALARVSASTTPLFWLPEDEEVAIEIVRIFIAHGADAAFRDGRNGRTAADAARTRGMETTARFLEGTGLS